MKGAGLRGKGVGHDLLVLLMLGPQLLEGAHVVHAFQPAGQGGVHLRLRKGFDEGRGGFIGGKERGHVSIDRIVGGKERGPMRAGMGLVGANKGM